MAPRKPPAAGPRKARAASSRRRAPAARALPAADGDAPLAELARDPLSVFLYVALTPEETRGVVKALGLSVPGFRTEALSDVERCDLLADELRAAPAARAQVLDALRKAFGRPPLVASPLDPAAAEDLLAVSSSEHALTLSLWRVLADPDPDVRARAVPILEELVAEYYAPGPEESAGPGAARQAEAPSSGDDAARADARVQELTRELQRAEERGASARRKAEEQREKLQEWLREARARAAQAVDEAARVREAADAAQRAREKAEAALAAVQATDAAAEVQRTRGALRDAEGRSAALEARLARAAEREEELAAALRALRQAQGERSNEARAQARPAPERPGAEVEPDEPEEAPADWLMPVYTREFYDSLEGWDRRIQRAAFKQANLLAQDHRHPSLRALPLEGLPGYYRVRVATDVRLLYRRGERQNTVEILSLIDREDLDRYVRQAKTRQ